MLNRAELRLCVQGFAPSETHLIERAVKRLDARWRPAWRVQADADADAFILSPAVHQRWMRRASESNNLTPAPYAMLDMDVLGIWPEQVLTELESTPGMAGISGEAKLLVDAVLAVLLRLELSLRRELLAYRIAAAVFRRHALAQDVSGAWLLKHGEKLLGTVDFGARCVEFDESTTQDELGHMHWVPHPTPLPICRHSHGMPLMAAMWLFSCYCPEHLMTMHYRFARVRLVNLPQVNPRYMTRHALKVVQVLSQSGLMGYKELSSRCELDGKQFSNTLAGLFFVGALQANWDDLPQSVMADSEHSMPSLVSGSWHMNTMARASATGHENASQRAKRIAQQSALSLRSWN